MVLPMRRGTQTITVAQLQARLQQPTTYGYEYTKQAHAYRPTKGRHRIQHRDLWDSAGDYS
jgi:hypothetical protein